MMRFTLPRALCLSDLVFLIAVSCASACAPVFLYAQEAAVADSATNDSAAATAPTTAAPSAAPPPAAAAPVANAATGDTDPAAPPAAAEAPAVPGAAPSAPADGGTAPAKAAAAAPVIPLHLQPYDVVVSVDCGTDPLLDVRFVSRMLESVGQQLSGRLEPHWNPPRVAARSETRLPPANDLDITTLPDQVAALQCDKLYAIDVRRTGAEYHISGCEYDATTRSLGHLVERRTLDRRLVSALAAGIVVECFRPIAQVTRNENGVLYLTGRAGELPPADVSLAPFPQGRWFSGVLRQFDKKKQVSSVTPVPWSFIQVGESERSWIDARLTSMYRALPPLRRRMDLFCIAVHAPLDETVIRVVPMRTVDRPVAGVLVDVVDRLPTPEDPVLDRLNLTADRFGEVRVPRAPAGESPIRYVLVRSGTSLLARNPILPGLESKITVKVPDDSARLSAAGQASILEGELIDAIARREVLMARTRQTAQAEKWDEANRFREELRKLAKLENFRTKITSLRVSAVQRAKQNRDRVAEGRINKICDGILDIAQQHLNQTKLEEFENEIRELEKLK